MENSLNDNIPNISTILRFWKEECGEIRTSQTGVQYTIIPSNRTRDSLKKLAMTLIGYGYTFEELDSVSLSVKIADVCWREDKIKKMSLSEIKKAKISLALDWNEAIAEFSGVVIADYEETKKAVPYSKKEDKKQEPILDIEPKDRIKVETSDMVDPPLDLDFLKELGIDEEFVTGKKNE